MRRRRGRARGHGAPRRLRRSGARPGGGRAGAGRGSACARRLHGRAGTALEAPLAVAVRRQRTESSTSRRPVLAQAARRG
eukprot:2441027-Alexandrium_andersonii.AAC.1